MQVIVRNHKRDWMFLRGSSVGEVHIPAHQILQQGTIDQEYGLLGVKSGSISMKACGQASSSRIPRCHHRTFSDC